MMILRNAIAIVALVASSGAVWAEGVQLFIGVEPCNNGEVATVERHKGCATRNIGHTIEAASAIPLDNFVEVFAGNDVVNNKIVSKDFNYLGGSMESIGYLSKNPIAGGKKLNRGNGKCNNGDTTTSTLHKGCGTEFLGYTAP
ncbi:hypothetical protein ACIPLA_11585 [Pseudomonas sp. NPDC086112]|uniref:hypothetical protein n=1 Tax=Pseudomonas sp. NPDC086112 TaxID=3364430 RepID=UPI00381EF941